MNASRLRIAFAGTPRLASILLEALIRDTQHECGLVFTQSDKPFGRGRRLVPTMVRQCAEAHGIPCVQTASSSSIDARILSDFDVLIVAAYGLILPAEVLAMPRFGCVNIHFSLLPRWRGATPIQHAILAGDAETGISIMQMTTGLDTGPVYWQRRCKIANNETAASLEDKLVRCGVSILPDFLGALPTLSAHEQNSVRATYAPKITKQMAHINWHLSAENIVRRIRAFNPAPVAYSSFHGERIRFWQAEPVETYDGRPGEVVVCDKQGIVVATGDGGVRLLAVQIAGKKQMSAFVFAHGRAGLLHSVFV